MVIFFILRQRYNFNSNGFEIPRKSVVCRPYLRTSEIERRGKKKRENRGQVLHSTLIIETHDVLTLYNKFYQRPVEN